MKAYIITDVGNGDGGKGTITDSTARHCGAVLNVRYNGGPQAAHTVVTPDCIKHTFSQFGSATFVGNCPTLLSRDVLVNPVALWYEAQTLEQLGVSRPLDRVFIDQSALVITPYHVIANRLREFDRGRARHGSCGKGIGETMADAIGSPELIIRVADLLQPGVFREKLEAVKRFKAQQLSSITERLSRSSQLPTIIAEALACLNSDQELEDTLYTYSEVIKRSQVVEDRELLGDKLREGAVVFEGAQGVLLDQDWGFHPYTTWSTTTSENARRLIASTGLEFPITTIGVTRCYQTRHGNGPLPTESRTLQKALHDANNPTNDWQGQFRFGWLDLVLLRYALTVNDGADYLAVTCLDDLSGLRQLRVATAYHGTTDLPIGKRGDLAHQEGLTALLQSARPIWSYQAPTPTFAAWLAERLSTKLGVCSYGPRSDQKEFLL